MKAGGKAGGGRMNAEDGVCFEIRGGRMARLNYRRLCLIVDFSVHRTLGNVIGRYEFFMMDANGCILWSFML